MKNHLLDIRYARRKERKSLLFVIALLVISSFIDEVFFILYDYSRIESDSVAVTENERIKEEITMKESSQNQKVGDSTEKEDRGASKEEVAVDFTRTSGTNAKYAGNSYQTKSGKQDVHSKEQRRLDSQTFPKNHELRNREIALELSPNSLLEKKEIKLMSIKIDPNKPQYQDLRTMGISESAARNWVKYVDAGGEFRNLDDLKKVYGIDSNHLELVSKNIKFSKTSKPKFNTQLSSIFINQASAYQFSKIPGIGPVLSERIIKFRSKLGGFNSYQQLKEIYGIEAELVEKHKDLFLLEESVIKININTCDENLLGAHSYCSYRTAKTIVNYREQHGLFSTAEDLLQIRIIDEKWLQKIQPYLVF